jgi:hypothetical protein
MSCLIESKLINPTTAEYLCNPDDQIKQLERGMGLQVLCALAPNVGVTSRAFCLQPWFFLGPQSHQKCLVSQ